MGRARARGSDSSCGLNLPTAPAFYPTEDEFRDPLEYIDRIRAEAEPFGICRIVPPVSWKPPFAIDLSSFSFLTKSQAIHHLQARSPASDPTTFDLEYGRFLKKHGGKKRTPRPVFRGEDLDICRLYNAVKRYGGYEKVCGDKKWSDVFRIACPVAKASPCSMHVLSQLYREHLLDYERYRNFMSTGGKKPVGKWRRRRRKVISAKGSGDSDATKKPKRDSEGEDHKEEDAQDSEAVGNADQICEQCGSGLHGEVMLLCDRCNRGWHIYCLSPPLERVPAGNWYCLECLNSDKDSFGFVPGKKFSIDAFRKLAERVKKRWFGSSSPTYPQIEKKFWEIVEGLAGEVHVIYGNDLDTSLYGSGFPRVTDSVPSSIDQDAWKEYCDSPWNLNNLPKLQGSLLQVVRDNITGVTVPWLYVGMLFSSFCWHVEDHCFYSMNYLHWGEPKCWYSIPGNEAPAFEKVMQKTLPDLFEAQPDLLFQLVTMLNPSLMQQNGVRVCSLVQEPGNFVITFPRAFHGGFNCGLNCAEAVNFAPFDWLPYGSLGADLYRLYHKPAILCHEELVCVVAKNCCTENAVPYLKEEMLKIFTKEKTYREELWRNGLAKSSLMSARKQPEFVSTEEDPLCIICQQYLFMSAVACDCRPAAFVCLEHWAQLCECNLDKRRLLYRFTLAELDDLLCMGKSESLTVCDLEENLDNQNTSSNQSVANLDKSNGLIKKVKGHYVHFSRLAKAWLTEASGICKSPFSSAAFDRILNQAEQFLWAGHEIDPVRHMASRLVDARRWADSLGACVSKIESWIHFGDRSAERVLMKHVEDLLHFDPLPCNVPDYLKLKVYAEDAMNLRHEIGASLSSDSHITIMELGDLLSKVLESPIDLEEGKMIEKEVSCVKVWTENVRRCLSQAESKATMIEADVLYSLEAEMVQLHVLLPEMEQLKTLLQHVEVWRSRSQEILKDPIKMKDLEVLLQDAVHLVVSTPELKILRQYHSDAVAWTDRCRAALEDISERQDHKAVVEELNSILSAGTMWSVQVEELSLVEKELRIAVCRRKASEALATRMPLRFMEQLMTEAAVLELENEKMFVDISDILAAAISWEQRAKRLLGSSAQMSEFDKALRDSNDIAAILPSRPGIEKAFSDAESWIRNVKPFIISSVGGWCASDSLLKVDVLEDLLSQVKLLKVSIKEPEQLKTVLKNIKGWQYDARTLLKQADSLLKLHMVDSEREDTFSMSINFIDRIQELNSRVKSAIGSGVSMGFDLQEIPKLRSVSVRLVWCSSALSLCHRSPVLKDVDIVAEDSKSLPSSCADDVLVHILIEGTAWARKALSLCAKSHGRRCRLEGVDDVLLESQRIKVFFPQILSQLSLSLEKHKAWEEAARSFFNCKSGPLSWSSLLQLKELGEVNAFDCIEMDKVVFEVEKVQNWMHCCEHVVGVVAGDSVQLVDALVMIRDSLKRSQSIFSQCNSIMRRGLCIYCDSSFKDDDPVACSSCEERYHVSCMRIKYTIPSLDGEYMCPVCLCLHSGDLYRRKQLTLISRRKEPTLDMFMELLESSNDFCTGIRERELVEEIVEKALECRLLLSKTVNQALCYRDKDITPISASLRIVMKALEVAGLQDCIGSPKLHLLLATYSWKMRVKQLLEGAEKPVMQQIKRFLKEGLEISIPLEDQLMQMLREMELLYLQWSGHAKEVSCVSGSVLLGEVLKLIKMGEDLPVNCEKELLLLKSQTVLHCICRKPYDQRPMIVCDRCDEWYHLDCINLQEQPPEKFLCAACEPLGSDFMCSTSPFHDEERAMLHMNDSCAATSPLLLVATPPLSRFQLKRRRRPRKARSNLQLRLAFGADTIKTGSSYSSSELDQQWRNNRKLCRRAARKRIKFDALTLSVHTQ